MIKLKWSEFWGSDLESQLYPLLAGWAELLWTFSCIFKTATKTLLHSSPLKWRYHVDKSFTKHLLHVIISYQGAYIKEKLYKSVYESIFSTLVKSQEGFPGGLDSKESAYNAGDPGSIPESGRSPGKGNGNPLHYSCLENPMDRGASQATVHGVAESDTTEVT